ncbi:MAG: hypothetical protein QNJ84_03365 [Alphaproteobacteria bacterium]|nr:hypothetical protein [Alphaproteobacteria bacterium]
MTNRPELPTETTPEGEQIVAPGVKPITLKDRLTLRADQPMAPKRNPNAEQKPCDLGLFDMDARRQIDLADFLRAASGGAHHPAKPKE